MIRKLTKKDSELINEYIGDEASKQSINWKLSRVCMNENNGNIDCIILITDEKHPLLEGIEFKIFKIAHFYCKKDKYPILQRCFISIINSTKYISFLWADDSMKDICEYFEMTHHQEENGQFYYHITLNNGKYNI